MSWLDKRIPGFEQDVRAFLTNKTNYIAAGLLVATVYQFHAGQLDAQGLVNGVAAALGMFTIRDALAKAET